MTAACNGGSSYLAYSGTAGSPFSETRDEFPCASVQDYEASSLATIETGSRFSFDDPSSGDARVGYYDRGSNRFTALTANERRIVTHFCPRRGEQYVRDLPNSTYV
jgi:hypothetical protein